MTLRKSDEYLSGASDPLALPVARLVYQGAEPDWQQSQLTFADQSQLDRAFELGVFHLAVPVGIDLEAARAFGRSLLSPKSPMRHVPIYGELEGFIALDNNQQTKLALRRERWDRHYPADIAHVGRQLDGIGIAIMREVLRQSGIPEQLWRDASGGYVTGEGTAFLNFAHYDTRSPALGLRPHTDYGFVTILDATAPGLQILMNGDFVDVPVLANHFVINFGEALSYVTQHANRSVGAVVHQVLRQKDSDPTRHSIVYFANPDLDGSLWQFSVDGEIKGSSSVEGLFAHLENRLTQ